jgi:transposase
MRKSQSPDHCAGDVRLAFRLLSFGGAQHFALLALAKADQRFSFWSAPGFDDTYPRSDGVLIYPRSDGVPFLESFGPKEDSDAPQYSAEVGHQVIELARSGTKVAKLAATFGMSDATIYNWLKQEKIDRGEVAGLSTEEALDLAAAKRRIKQLETELAVSRKVNEVFLDQDLAPKASSR